MELVFDLPISDSFASFCTTINSATNLVSWTRVLIAFDFSLTVALALIVCWTTIIVVIEIFVWIRTAIAEASVVATKSVAAHSSHHVTHASQWVASAHHATKIWELGENLLQRKKLA